MTRRWILTVIAAAAPLAAVQGESVVEHSHVGSPVLLVSTSSGLSEKPLQRDEGAAGRAVLTVGRNQDIVGAMVSVSALQRPKPDVASDKKGGALTGAIPRGFPLRSAVLTSTFGMRPHPVLGGVRGHGGVDLAAPAGAPVFATGPGKVVSAGWAGGYGLLVTIDHGGGKQSRYGHLSAASVSMGQIVPAGTVVGFVGATGLATGPHLHYEIRINGDAVDPTRVAR